MTDETEKRRSGIGWGIPASILLHAVFAGILFFHLPLDVSEPQQEESVSVEIVPPPEETQEKAEEAKQEEQKPPEPPAAEEAEKEEPPPPPEPPKQEEAKEEPPPQPQPQEEAKQPEPPPPQQEEAKPEEQSLANEQARGQPIPTLRPVFEFGEKDAGPRKSETGNASQDTATPPVESEPDAEAAEEPKPSEEEPTVAEEPPANPVPDDIKVPEVDVASSDPQQNGSASETSPDAVKADIAAAPSATAAQGKPPETPAAEKPSELTEAKTLFSQNETGDPIATAAMSNVPRGVRAGQLCATEMQAQLRHASPPHRPEIVQVYRLSSGTVLEVRRGAFRASAQWYDLSFRCEVDENATKVLSFAFDVGAPVPRSEWRKRGFPQF
ncbi:DUF930 domain-containing protein [Neorhizobium petrolearium]|uniref:DUF930 domain-containing protein n=1 Tax=Neorhizobium petrolearium TaxID=515361 RepID=UPI003F18B91C